MLWKVAFVALLAVGVFGEYTITEEQRQQVKQAITKTCKESNAEDKATEAEAAVKTFVDCLKGLFNPETINQEIKDAKPHGALDEVFKKYCAKSPELKSCISAALTGVAPCVPAKYRAHIPTATNATNNLIDFACYKDGDRIALFIAESGVECFTEKREDIKTCAENLTSSVPSLAAAKALTEQEQCSKFNQLSTCVVEKLETCSFSSTPANMADALFNFLKRGTPCAAKQ